MEIGIDTVFLLDIDGVINEPQQSTTNEMTVALQRLSRHFAVYFVTGNTYTKSVDIINGALATYRGIFCNNADELRSMRGKLIWQDTYTSPLPFIDNLLMQEIFQDIEGNNCIEWRSPRFVNVSRIGRYASQTERDAHDGSWRDSLMKVNGNVLAPIEISIGGSVSVDIYSKGADKARAAKWINSQGKKFIFLGDKTSPGGNDYCVKKYCEDNPENICLTIMGQDDTLKFIEGVLDGV